MSDKELAEKIVDLILENLDKSTWRDENFLGYNQLLEYREDMVLDALYVIERNR